MPFKISCKGTIKRGQKQGETREFFSSLCRVAVLLRPIYVSSSSHLRPIYEGSTWMWGLHYAVVCKISALSDIRSKCHYHRNAIDRFGLNPNRSIDCYALNKISFCHLSRHFSVTMEPHCSLKVTRHLLKNKRHYHHNAIDRFGLKLPKAGNRTSHATCDVGWRNVLHGLMVGFVSGAVRRRFVWLSAPDIGRREVAGGSVFRRWFVRNTCLHNRSRQIRPRQCPSGLPLAGR